MLQISPDNLRQEKDENRQAGQGSAMQGHVSQKIG
jgi:hypothetical protein